MTPREFSATEDEMTPQEKKEAYRQRCREQERARREALGLPQHPLAPAPKRRRAPKLSQYQRGEFADAAFGTFDNLGESPDY